MYSQIVDPRTNLSVEVNSTSGRQLLKSYLNEFMASRGQSGGMNMLRRGMESVAQHITGSTKWDDKSDVDKQKLKKIIEDDNGDKTENILRLFQNYTNKRYNPQWIQVQIDFLLLKKNKEAELKSLQAQIEKVEQRKQQLEDELKNKFQFDDKDEELLDERLKTFFEEKERNTDSESESERDRLNQFVQDFNAETQQKYDLRWLNAEIRVKYATQTYNKLLELRKTEFGENMESMRQMRENLLQLAAEQQSQTEKNSQLANKFEKAFEERKQQNLEKPKTREEIIDKEIGSYDPLLQSMVENTSDNSI